MFLPRRHPKYLPKIFLQTMSIIFNQLLWLTMNSKLCAPCKKRHMGVTKNCDKCRERKRMWSMNNADKRRKYEKEARLKNPEKYAKKMARYQATPGGSLVLLKNNAKKRNIPFELEDEYVKYLTSQNCFYCDKETTIDKRNSIDRMINSDGYTIRNSVSCCSVCNVMKVCLDALTFIERCIQIDIGVQCHYWIDISYKSYAKYKSSVTRDGKEFVLSQEEYELLRKGKCTYCKRPSTDTHHNGIDRINSEMGYTIENCIPCCHDCNISKGKMSPEAFVEQNKKIAELWKDNIHTISNIPRQTYIWSNLSKTC